MISLSFTYIHLGLITIGLYKLSYARYMPANTTTRDQRPQGHASGIIDGMPIFAVISKNSYCCTNATIAQEDIEPDAPVRFNIREKLNTELYRGLLNAMDLGFRIYHWTVLRCCNDCCVNATLPLAVGRRRDAVFGRFSNNGGNIYLQFPGYLTSAAILDIGSLQNLPFHAFSTASLKGMMADTDTGDASRSASEPAPGSR